MKELVKIVSLQPDWNKTYFYRSYCGVEQW